MDASLYLWLSNPAILKAKKSYGQHFLVQQRTIERIAGTIRSFDMERVLEIGPGRAALTDHLIGVVPDFMAVEADRDMMDFLLARFPDRAGNFIHSDVLRMDFDRLFEGRPFLLCGNFPYNISSQIVFRMLELRDRVPVMVGMFQKEMARRIIAAPGSKDYGIISVMAGLFYAGRISFDVGPENFVPPPNVMSSILVLKRNEFHLDEKTFRAVLRLVKMSFQHRRKTLRNNLRQAYPDHPLLVQDFFGRRPEDLAPQEYVALCANLNKE